MEVEKLEKNINKFLDLTKKDQQLCFVFKFTDNKFTVLSNNQTVSFETMEQAFGYCQDIPDNYNIKLEPNKYVI
jgi:hypothetical protein